MFFFLFAGKLPTLFNLPSGINELSLEHIFVVNDSVKQGKEIYVCSTSKYAMTTSYKSGRLTQPKSQTTFILIY